MIPIVFAAVISTMHLEADVSADNGDYVVVPFDVPAGTVELDFAHVATPADVILDFGVWDPSGFRGWGGGLTDATTIGVAESTRGYLPGAMTPGTWSITIGKAKLPSGTGHYAIDLTFRDDATLTPRARAPYPATVLDPTARWYRGDLHVHDVESGDAHATLDEIITLARSRKLDFVVLSDHNTISQHALIAALQANLPDLLLVRGNEVTTYAGHGGAFGSSAYVDHRIGLGGRTAAQMIADVDAQGALFIINHPILDLGTACIGCAWKHDDTPWDMVAAVEIETGNYTQWKELFETPTLQYWDTQLDAGHRLAAVGGSDDHRAGQDTSATGSEVGTPTTVVYAAQLSEAALLDGIRHGRTEVALRGPDDPLVELTTADGKAIGDDASGSRVALTAHVTGGSGLVLELVENGARTQMATVDSDDWKHTFHVEVPKGGERVRAHLTDGLDAIVVTSHLWLSYAPSSGCAIAPAHATTSAALVLVALAALGLFVRRVRRRARPATR